MGGGQVKKHANTETLMFTYTEIPQKHKPGNHNHMQNTCNVKKIK